MDLLSEASTGPRVLTARHVSDMSPELNNAINTTLLCHTYSLQPDFATYSAVLKSNGWVLWSVGLLVVLVVWLLYVFTLRAAKRHWKDAMTSVAIVLAVYPIVTSVAFLVTVIPRAVIISEAIAQEAVMVAMYHFYYMVITECGGVNQLVRRSEGSRLETRVLPCCCWPCCALPRPQVQKKSLTLLKYLVLQMPIIQGLLYVIMLTLWAEDMMLYMHTLVYMLPFVAASILSGLWSMNMCINAAELSGSRPRPRFIALQLVLVIVKLQCGIAKALPDMANLPCLTALHPSVFVNMIQHIIMMLEMLLLSMWAYRLYSAPPGKDPDRVQHVVVAVLEDSFSSEKSKDDKS